MNSKEIVKEIVAKKEVKSIVLVGCGASKVGLYPTKYSLDQNAKQPRISHYTVSGFNYATPAPVDEPTVVIPASLGGTTPETVEANAVVKEKGATVISLTRSIDSPSTEDADHVTYH